MPKLTCISHTQAHLRLCMSENQADGSIVAGSRFVSRRHEIISRNGWFQYVTAVTFKLSMCQPFSRLSLPIAVDDIARNINESSNAGKTLKIISMTGLNRQSFVTRTVQIFGYQNWLCSCKVWFNQLKQTVRHHVPSELNPSSITARHASQINHFVLATSQATQVQKSSSSEQNDRAESLAVQLELQAPICTSLSFDRAGRESRECNGPRKHCLSFGVFSCSTICEARSACPAQTWASWTGLPK